MTQVADGGQGNALGPLADLSVVEFASVCAGPHCGVLLSDRGTEGLWIDRAGGNGSSNPSVDRGRVVQTVDDPTEMHDGRQKAVLKRYRNCREPYPLVMR